MNLTVRSLEEQRAEFSKSRFLAMPLAGTVAWAAVAVAGATLKPGAAALALFVATGSILYLGMFISRYTGEHFLDKTRLPNVFDRLFMHCVAMSVMVYAIAIPFFRVDRTSLPLTVGILAGLMWIPLSWIIQHRIGIFHTVARTIAIVVLWYALPNHRFTAIPLAIVAVYLITIAVLESRWRAAARVTRVGV